MYFFENVFFFLKKYFLKEQSFENVFFEGPTFR